MVDVRGVRTKAKMKAQDPEYNRFKPGQKGTRPRTPKKPKAKAEVGSLCSQILLLYPFPKMDLAI